MRATRCVPVETTRAARASFSLVLVAVLGLSASGCAAVFRRSEVPVAFESDPPGSEVTIRTKAPVSATTPFEAPVPRAGLTPVQVTRAGYEEYNGSIRKRVNGGWLAFDVVTCVVPVLLCVPLLVDAVTGAWNDVPRRYMAPLSLRSQVAPVAGAAIPAEVRAPLPAVTVAQPVASSNPAALISESERKAAARSAFIEGAELQAKGNFGEALSSFQKAEALFSAPTHLFHIAQCFAMSGNLVEAQETYETLSRVALPPGAPEPFLDAVATGKRDLEELRPRIPGLRIEVSPDPSTLRNLTLTMNRVPLPLAMVGVLRPLNPGTYRIQATGSGTAALPVEVTLRERDTKTVTLNLTRR